MDRNQAFRGGTGGGFVGVGGVGGVGREKENHYTSRSDVFFSIASRYRVSGNLYITVV